MNENPSPKDRFQPGVSGNPNGRPSLEGPILEARRLNRQEFEKLVNEVIHLSIDDLQTLIKDKTQNGIKIMLASVLVKAISTGDNKRADFFINRLIGKVPERFENQDGEPLSFIGLVKLAGEKDETLGEV